MWFVMPQNGMVIDGVGDELRRLWLQVALTRAKLQDGTPMRYAVLLGIIERALSLDEHVLIARCLECIPVTALSR